MSALLSSPRVTVHIGDGFAFLASHTSTYDVIITDSSDPVGPAATLFEKPYFQLLHDALTPGGRISTQGECLWLHLSLIRGLRDMAGGVFVGGQVEYAYTTIPTYPAGQIGFMVCAKAGGEKHDLKVPVRDVPETRYYNRALHPSSFILPEFARVYLETNGATDLRPTFGKALVAATASPNTPTKKILLLGSGFVARPCAEYILRSPFNHLTIACRTLSRAQALGADLPPSQVAFASLDVNDTQALEAAVAEVDLVISLIPYTHHAAVIKAAIKGRTHVVTTSYVSPAMRELDEEAKKAGIVVMNEIGLDPGIDHLYAVKTIGEVHEQGGKIKEFHSYCGGLPAPECSGNPLGYKFSWSSRGVLLALLNNAGFLANSQPVHISGKELMAAAKPYFISPAYAFVAYPNRDSTPFSGWYGIPEATDVVRYTLRYQGFPQFVEVLVKIGWLDAEEKVWVKEGGGLTWAQAMQKILDAPDAEESTLVKSVKERCVFPDEAEETRIISGLRWMGLFSSEPLQPRGGNLLDTLCARLEGLMAYETGERDLVMLQHRFIIEWPASSPSSGPRTEIRTSTLEAYGSTAPGGYSAMARTVGVPCGIAVQLVLDGVLATPGVHAPYTKEVCEPLRRELEKEGLGLVERTL